MIMSMGFGLGIARDKHRDGAGLWVGNWTNYENQVTILLPYFKKIMNMKVFWHGGRNLLMLKI